MEAAAAVARAAAAAAADKAVVICSRLSPPDSTRTPASAGRERLGATWLLGGTWLEAPMARTERTSVCLSLESQEAMRRSCGALRVDSAVFSRPATARRSKLSRILVGRHQRTKICKLENENRLH